MSFAIFHSDFGPCLFQYEFKAKGVKKKKVLLEVSVDGVRVSLRKKKKVGIVLDACEKKYIRSLRFV